MGPEKVMHKLCFGMRALRITTMMRSNTIQVITDPGTGRDLRMIWSSGGKFLGEITTIKIVTLIGQALRKRLSHHHDSLMRTVSFVGGKQVNVSAQVAHVR